MHDMRTIDRILKTAAVATCNKCYNKQKINYRAYGMTIQELIMHRDIKLNTDLVIADLCATPRRLPFHLC